MSTLVRAGIGTWKANARWVFAAPRLAETRPGIIWCHGGGGAGATAMGTIGDANRGVFLAVARHYPILAVDDAGSAFGNASDRADLAAAIDFLHTFSGVDAGPVGAIGGSQGNQVAMNYYRDNPGTIACVAGIIPLCDVDDARDNDRGGFRDTINTAHGLAAGSTSDYPTHGSSLAALPEGINPADSLPTGLPWKAWYAENDNICVQATVLAMAEALDAEAVNVGTGGHSGVSVAAVDTTSLVAFFNQQL